jgi:hypothetical protein
VFLDNKLPAYEAGALAAEQRPLSLAALTETSGTPAWKTIPSWYMVATQDMVTNPGPVTQLIEDAATATTG